MVIEGTQRRSGSSGLDWKAVKARIEGHGGGWQQWVSSTTDVARAVEGYEVLVSSAEQRVHLRGVELAQ